MIPFLVSRENFLLKRAPDVEETRIRPTVIRRRRKAAPEPSVAEAPSPEEDSAVDMDTGGEAEPVADEKTVSFSTKEKEIPEAAGVEEVLSPSVEETDQETVAEASSQDEAEKAPDMQVEKVSEQPASEEVQQVADAVAADTGETPEKTGAVEIQKDESAVPSDETEKAVAVPAKPKKTKEKKKAKKDAPAKIIQLPEKPVVPPKGKKKPPVETVVADSEIPVIEESPGVSEPTSPTTREKRGKRGKKEEVDQERKFLKKKIAFRRKEVIEGAALYTGQRAGKGRKKGKAKQAVRTETPDYGRQGDQTTY